MAAELWAKPPEGQACSLVTAITFHCNTWQNQALMESRSELPDATGWCVYEDRIPATYNRVCLYVETAVSSPDVVLVDSARIMPIDGTAPMLGRPRAQPRPEQSARLRAFGEILNERRRF
ncbi:MAG: hypothetical protein JRI23_31905 [Deltaproteobacteria bacterium]|jgi:hypothetical protein|nr:hypothetical protein [Deltaproteobacteria bacterium]MBW2536829.1 hypothetical protein [Deltaproteobacteria bacterium]